MIGWLTVGLLLLLRPMRGLGRVINVSAEVPAEVYRGEREISPGWERPAPVAPVDQRPCAQAAIAPKAQVHPCAREFSAGRDHGR